MNDTPGGSDTTGGEAWFAGCAAGDVDAAAGAIADGTAEAPADWPAQAVDAGVVASEAEYYDWLHEAATAATREAVAEAGRAGDTQLVHAVRAMDDARRLANELAERVTEWGVASYGLEESGLGAARALVDREPVDDADRRLVALAEQVLALEGEASELRDFVERRAPSVAPNLSAMAGPVLAARLVALAGGLEELAKLPSGTVQVLGAEEALFAHLRGEAPSPKHGVIYTHEYVRGTRPADRGSAARALAGKLSIAARVDHYAGDRRPELDAELDERIARIRARADDGDDGGSGASTDGGRGGAGAER
ncbi:MAG: NOP5/NOP56 family protein [Halobacteriaceae archaeon]